MPPLLLTWWHSVVLTGQPGAVQSPAGRSTPALPLATNGQRLEQLRNPEAAANYLLLTRTSAPHFSSAQAARAIRDQQISRRCPSEEAGVLRGATYRHTSSRLLPPAAFASFDSRPTPSTSRSRLTSPPMPSQARRPHALRPQPLPTGSFANPNLSRGIYRPQPKEHSRLRTGASARNSRSAAGTPPAP